MPWSTIAAVQVIAGNTIINPNGLFMYNSSGPGAGNLIFSIANLGVSADAFGNAVQGGGAAAYGTTPQLAFLSTASLQFQVNSGDINSGFAAEIAAASSGVLVLSSGQQSGLDANAQAFLTSSSASGIGRTQFSTNATQNIFNLTTWADPGSVPTDNNSGTTWVAGERAFMNNNWVAYMNSVRTQLTTMLG